METRFPKAQPLGPNPFTRAQGNCLNGPEEPLCRCSLEVTPWDQAPGSPPPRSFISLIPLALQLAETTTGKQGLHASCGLCEERNRIWLPKMRSRAQCRFLQGADVTSLTWFRRHQQPPKKRPSWVFSRPSKSLNARPRTPGFSWGIGDGPRPFLPRRLWKLPGGWRLQSPSHCFWYLKP